MIKCVIIKNYRIFKNLHFEPNPAMNIIVGDNEAGKSTLIEAIGMALEGRVNGRRLMDELNPYWFNNLIVEDYFAQQKEGRQVAPPKICIEVFLDKLDEPQTLRGRVNSLKKDCPGFAIEVELDSDFVSEFEQYMSKQPPSIIPTEYFKVTWRGFDGKALYRRPKEVGLLYIDSRTSHPSRQIDYRARQLLKELVDDREGAEISVKYRQARHSLVNELLQEVNTRIHQSGQDLDRELTLGLDQSSLSGWESAVVPHVDGLPVSYAGHGEQVLMKTVLAMTNEKQNPRFIFVEEPENHLSHTSLLRSLNQIQQLAKGRQVFATTHSSYVLNRMGVKHLKLVHKGTLAKFGDLDDDTQEYFKKQSGYDTLRMVLARKLVIVEGPSDEMVFKRAYLDKVGRTTEADQVDVIVQGTRNRRGLELCAALGRKVAVLRDNDGREPQYWKDLASPFLELGARQLFIGALGRGRTLEPQVVNANMANPDRLRRIIAAPHDQDLEKTMVGDKTGWAWRVAQSAETIAYPDYIIEAIAFVEQM